MHARVRESTARVTPKTLNVVHLLIALGVREGDVKPESLVQYCMPVTLLQWNRRSTTQGLRRDRMDCGSTSTYAIQHG